MSEPILPILPMPTSHPPAEVSNSTGEGAQSALAALIRKRKMGENNPDEQSLAAESAPKEVPAATD